MVEDARKNPRLIGGIYQVGQAITVVKIITNYTAYNRNTNDVVGLFVFDLLPQIVPETVLRLLEPFEKRRQVESSHVMHVFDWGIDGRRVYIATDPPRGIALRTILDNETLDLKRTVEIAKQAVQGLFALQARTIHNIDMRPQFITVDRVNDIDRVQLDDTGLRLILKQMGYTLDERYDDIGYFDPRYVSPEYLQGGQVGIWSDVYHVGLLLFEMITGRPPYVGRSTIETKNLQCNGPIPQMIEFRKDIPQAYQQFVEHALAKEPVQRYPNAGALLEALEALPIQYEQGQAAVDLHAGILSIEDSTVVPEVMSSDAQVKDVAPESRHGVDSSKVYAYLFFDEEGKERRTFAITSTYVIVGRVDPKRGLKPEVDLTTIDTGMTVSRQHARIRYEKTFFSIEDLKSRNKTWLGEITLTPMKAEVLKDGDVLKFGSVRVKFKVSDPG